MELQNSLQVIQQDTNELNNLKRDKNELKSRNDLLEKEIINLRQSLNTSQTKSSQRDNEYKNQIAILNQKLHNYENQMNDMNSEIADATMPLSLEIEKLQKELKSKGIEFDRRESSLIAKLNDLEFKLKTSIKEKDEANSNYNLQITVIDNCEKLIGKLQSENEILKLELEKCSSEVNRKIELLINENKELKDVINNLNEQLVTMKTTNDSLTTQLNNEVKKSEQLHEESRRERSPSNHSTISEASYLDDVLDNNVHQQSPKSYFDSNFSSINLIENLQGQLRQKELELIAIQDQMLKNDKIRKMLNDEIANLTVQNQELLLQLEQLGVLQSRLENVESNYNAVLQVCVFTLFEHPFNLIMAVVCD